MIRAINAREGQHVNAGDVLIELDPTSATAVAAERALISARIEEYEAKRQSLEERRNGAESALAATQAEIDKLQQTLPLLKEQFESERQLAADGFGARQKLLQIHQAYITAQQDLAAQKVHLREARAQMSSLLSDEAQTREQFLGTAAQERAEAEGSVAERMQALTKANEKKARMLLKAPVSGTIQEVTVTTIGQTPEVGKPLITLIADGEDLVAEGLLLNRDAGFVHENQPVTIKLEAFSFTRYGVLHGVVERVSPDATVNEHRGLVFPIRVRLTDRTLNVNGHATVLSAGMSASLEIVTGERRVIDYLWSPVAKTLREAGREK